MSEASDRVDERAFYTLALALAAIKLLLHLALVTRYGYHRDELYFIACGKHLALGYVDHAPLVPWIAGTFARLFDYSLLGLRLLPALAGAATLLVTAKLVRALRGGLLALALSGVALIMAPVYLRTAKMLCIPAFEPLLWTSASLLLLRALETPERRGRWIALGLVVGVGLLDKHSMLLWVAGAGAGLVLTPHRAQLRRPWPWIGVAIALALLSLNAAWQLRHGFATVEFLANMSRTTLAQIPRALFVAGQFLYLGPLAAPLWLTALVWLFRAGGKPYRLFGWAFVVQAAALLVTHAKPYYLAPAYPLLFAIGAVVIARWVARRARPRAVAGAMLALQIGASAPLAALSLPLARLPAMDGAFERLLGAIVKPTDLTHDLHDEHGWPEQAAAVARVYRALPAAERRRAVVLTSNYGEASAINFFGPRHGLPRAVSGHMTYWLWGLSDVAPARRSGEVVIAYGMPRRALLAYFGDVRERGRIRHALAMERDVPIFVCRKPRQPLRVMWPRLRRYYHGRNKPPARR
ncbi:MAG: glycosyltransferase family 39 protein [Myxococcales bacterium]|nr:glycosyltransferase family 39 protein [Myxococcales bacterium]